MPRPLQTYIDQRLRYGVRVKLEQQIIAGNGTNPNMSGIIGNTANHTALTVVTADGDFDAANRAKYQVVNADYMPDVFLINPADWGRIERKKDGNNPLSRFRWGYRLSRKRVSSDPVGSAGHFVELCYRR